MGKYCPALLLAGLATLTLSCDVHVGPLEGTNTTGAETDAIRGEVWVYTSMYQPVLEELNPLVAKHYPDVKLQWYRAGSEVVARRLDTEIQAGGTQADLVMTADPFWYLKMKNKGMLATHTNVPMLSIPRRYIDADGTFVATRISTMAIAYNPKLIAETDVPRSYKALAEDRYDGMVTLGDPLSSGTNFSTMAFLSDRYGWQYYRTLREHGTIASGGNSSVLRRIEGGEAAMGLVLLENVLANQAGGSPVKYVIPDQPIIIPGMLAMLESSDNKTAARALFDLFMGQEALEIMVKWYMHVPELDAPGPAGTPPFAKYADTEFAWTPEFMAEVAGKAENIKTKFSETMKQ